MSGINNGFNLSEDVFYSGTVGAAIEGSFRGVLPIAISQCYDAKTIGEENIYDFGLSSEDESVIYDLQLD